MKKYNLSVLSIFKNESMILEEWLNHYINEGIDHFYLLNNNSTDNYKDIIDKYKDYIDLYNAKEDYQQTKHLNSKLSIIKLETEWLLVCDLDEFIFAKEDFKKIPDIIETLCNKIKNVGQIRIPWMIFSSNNFINQPNSVISSFTDRNNYNKNKYQHNLKYIVKTNLIINLEVHKANINGKTILSNGIEFNKTTFTIKKNLLEDHLLGFNHYILQSKDWFLNIKKKRGSVRKAEHDKLRDIAYFNEYDKKYSGYNDYLLKNKIYKNNNK